MNKFTMTESRGAETGNPTLEFPCQYPIKVIGVAGEGLRQRVIDIMRANAGDIDESQITERESSEGRFLSVTVVITATGKPQLDTIFAELKATGIVKMVL
ncbi:YbeD family protein [Zhongshania sp.]|jgi:putative lipoic acid-binding regulatory protein|uniref:HP0495 family protein n=1 Tax=Zhongshania sp. TaxID=1971902 RepID=UPI0039E557E7